MKTLFLKSNTLHIRTNEGVFEVSNPEVAMYGTAGNGAVIWKPYVTDNCEWPYGVELIELYQLNGTDGWVPFESVSQARGGTFTRKLFAQLLPKEEKKDDIQPKRWEESTSIPSESAYKTVSSNTQTCGKFEIKSHYDFEPVESSEPAESAYKEFEGKGKLIGHIIDDFKNSKEIFVPAVESSEPQEKEPTAYQKRKAIEKRAVWLKYCLDIGWTKDQLDGLEKIWDQHHDEFGNLIKGVSAPSESQEELWAEVKRMALDKKYSLQDIRDKFTISRNNP